MKDKPFYAETRKLIDYVSQHDLDKLAALCDDDFGIVDIDPEGKSVVIKDREGWENWFHSLFAKLKELKAETWTEIVDYNVLTGRDLAYSVVYFDQYFQTAEQKLKFHCLTTIIWKNTANGWKESRWHSSMLEVKPVE